MAKTFFWCADDAVKFARDILIPSLMAGGVVEDENFVLVIGCRSTRQVMSVLVIGGTIQKEYDLKKIALSKFELTCEYGMSTRQIQMLYPEMADGKTCFWGSAIDGDIVVAGSGYKSRDDEMVCTMVVAYIRKQILAAQAQYLESRPVF